MTTVPATNGSPPQSNDPSAAKVKKGKDKAKAALDPAVIEAKRKERAEKKEREARERAAKEAEAAANGVNVAMVDGQGNPLHRPRPWATVPETSGEPSTSTSANTPVKVLSWNMLAQGLVRRKLFPGSDALRWKDREAGLAAELSGHDWDVGCFQEVDRIEVHTETLRKAGYARVYSKGYSQKQHGLMLAWRTSRPAASTSTRATFEEEPVAHQTFFFDDAEVSPGRCASSRITRNIALFAALKFKHAPGGVILATTHLFWHPMHAYERVRQTALLVRALNDFRQQQHAQWAGWSTILAGDFNDQPHSASYRLLTGMGLNEHGKEEILASRVVHQSVDEREKMRKEGSVGEQQQASMAHKGLAISTPADDQHNGDDDDEVSDGEEPADDEEGGADDQMLKNCRAAKDSDGLLTLDELSDLFPSSAPLRSAYAAGYHTLLDPSESDNLFSTVTRGRERWDDKAWKEGDLNTHRHLQGTSAGNEPMWTLYSSLFSLTLDFIFLLPTAGVDGTTRSYPQVTKLLRTHRTDVLKDGLPRKGICVSDHIAIGAEIRL